ARRAEIAIVTPSAAGVSQKRPTIHCRLTTATDRNPRIMAQLAGEIAVAVPLYLPLIDRQDVPSPGISNDIPFPDFLFEMRAGDGDVFVVRVIRLGLLFDHRLLSQGRAESQRPDRRTHN